MENKMFWPLMKDCITQKDKDELVNFIKSNINGTFHLLKICNDYLIKKNINDFRFIQFVMKITFLLEEIKQTKGNLELYGYRK